MIKRDIGTDDASSGNLKPVMDINQNLRSSTLASLDDKEVFLRKIFEEDPKKGCEVLFRQFYQPMCSHAVRFVYSKEIAQDIVGDIFYTLLHKKLYTTITSSFRAYLFIAVRNRSLKYLRKEFGVIDEKIEPGDLDLSSSQPSPQQIMQFNELNFQIDTVIKNLAPQCQKVFLLNRFEGKKYQQIAEELNVSVKTVEAHISKALHVLRNTVRNELIIIIFFLIRPFTELG